MENLKMTDKQFLMNFAAICEMLLKNAGSAFGLDFAVINDTMIELDKRAHALGITRKELYPNEKRP